MTDSSFSHPHSKARVHALEFLYQCHCEKVHFFSPIDLEDFAGFHAVPDSSREYLERLCRGVMDEAVALDGLIGKASTNWRVERLAVIDKIILRLAVWEMTTGAVDRKVAINEAVELGKAYGSNKSKGFINGVLDGLDLPARQAE